MAAYRDCPQCGKSEAIKIDLLPYERDTNWGGFPDIVEVECDCVLEVESQDAILKEFESWTIFDWDDGGYE